MSREASQAAERRLCLLWRTIEQLALLAEQLSGLQGLRPSTGRKALFSGALSLLILQGNTLFPFEYYKGILSFPSNRTREYS